MTGPRNKPSFGLFGNRVIQASVFAMLSIFELSCGSSGKSSPAPCSAPLDSFGCEATFAAETGKKHNAINPRAGLCGAYLVVTPLSPGGGYCLYDGQSEELVGAEGGSDIPDFCDGTSNTIKGGVDVNPYDLCNVEELPAL